MDEVNILFIGDPHIKADNIPESDLLINDIISKIKNIKPDLCIIGGDLMHYHEKLYTIPLNKAYEFVKRCSYEVPTYVLVGNHDMINNQQFLTENHWMNGMKTWKEDVHIIDKVKHISLKNHNFMLCPYVYPGRFVEALDTIKEQFNWKDANIIFAHQEFKGCKMGAITSIEGDEWEESNPMVISGHIHNKQKPQQQADRLPPPRTLILDFTMTHPRYGRSHVHPIGQLTNIRRSDGAPEPDGVLQFSCQGLTSVVR